VTSPVEGTVAYSGRIEERQTILSKGGRRIYLDNVMGGKAALFSGGFYINFYLNPRDRHYWRTPYDGKFTHTQINEGKSRLPVFIGLERLFKNGDIFDLAVRYNASIASVLETKRFPLGMIAVGSLNVSGIHVLYQEGAGCMKGDLCGYFSIGSSMLMCFPAGEFSDLTIVGRRVHVGMPIVRIGGGGA
jgi:phosphatidylserine decarboxylase